jgi:hypothetical protein
MGDSTSPRGWREYWHRVARLSYKDASDFMGHTLRKYLAGVAILGSASIMFFWWQGFEPALAKVQWGFIATVIGPAAPLSIAFLVFMTRTPPKLEREAATAAKLEVDTVAAAAKTEKSQLELKIDAMSVQLAEMRETLAQKDAKLAAPTSAEVAILADGNKLIARGRMVLDMALGRDKVSEEGRRDLEPWHRSVLAFVKEKSPQNYVAFRDDEGHALHHADNHGEINNNMRYWLDKLESLLAEAFPA